MSKKQLNDYFKNHIIDLYDRNYKVSKIAEIYQVTNKTIYNMITKYKNMHTIERKIGSGKKQDDNMFNLIKIIVDDNNTLSLVQISAYLLQNYNIKCSKSTVHEYLIKNDYVNKKNNK